MISNPEALLAIHKELQSSTLSKEEKLGLEGCLQFFSIHNVESEEAKLLQEKILKLESDLYEKRRTMRLDYRDPSTGDLTKQHDPYSQFDQSLTRWMQSFSSLEN